MAKYALLLLAVAGFIISSSAQSPPAPPFNTGQEKQEVGSDKNIQAHNENRTQSSFDYNALAITVFTGVLALVAWLQLRATRKQAEYMADGLKLTERSADAARESAEAATQAVKTSLMTERAIVLVENVRATTQ